MRLSWPVLLRALALSIAAAGFIVGCFPWAAAAATPGVTITPVTGAAAHGTYQDGEVVSVTVPDNSVFTPGAKVNILECADPHGTAANLPKDISSCDGLTIQGDTALVQRGGAVSVPRYTVYRLPSPTLGEQSNAQPACDSANQCVLYVGQNENDFTQPKLFSSPFTVLSSSSVPAAAVGSATSSEASAPPVTSAPSDATANGTQSSLAFTGPGVLVPWLIVTGGVLLAVGVTGRRWTKAGS